MMAECGDWNKRTCTDGRLSVLDEPAFTRMQEPLLPPSAFERGHADSSTTSLNLSRHPQNLLLNQPPCRAPGQNTTTGLCEELGLINDPTATREQHVWWDLNSAVNVRDAEVAPWKTGVGRGCTFPAPGSFALIGTNIVAKPAWKTGGWSDGEKRCVLGSGLDRERKAREKAEESHTKISEKKEEAVWRNMDVEKRLAEAEKKVEEAEELCVKAERRCMEAEERWKAAEGELVPLQTELENQRAKHQKERSHFESKLQLAENSRLQMQLQLEQQQQKHLAEMIQKREELEKAATLRESLEGQLREAQDEIECKQALLQHLRAYVGGPAGVTTDHRLLEQHVKEKEMLAAQIKGMDKEREALALRVDALSDILAVQEDMLTQAKRLPAHLGSDGTGAEVLLTRWRTKVFSLMVQLKSLQLSQKEEEAKHKAQKQALQIECNHVQKELKLVQISMSDRDAQVQLLRAKVQTLCADLTVTQAALVREEECRRMAECALQRLGDLAKRSHQVMMSKEEALGVALDQLAGLQSRVAFAGSRLGIVQGAVLMAGLFARREAFLKLEIQSHPKGRTHIDEDDGDMERVSRAEVQNLLDEREHLATQIKHDATAIESRIARARQDAEEELHEAKAKAASEGRRADEAQKEAATLAGRLEEAQKELQSAWQAWSRQELDLNAQHTTDLARMDTLLNQARHEHSKAVVAVCQAERRASREKERVEVELSTLHQQMKRHGPDLEELLQNCQIGRGLLSTTLQQEGPRLHYTTRQATASKPPVPLLHTVHQPAPNSLPDQQGTPLCPPGPTDVLMKKLQVLSCAVLDPDNDGESDG
uniref:coiled-coil alpha-helical rod protein 1 isoform X3 n=1 Tax=Myxine glutinosa TaxID=7769 RepID=UPI00358F9609